MKIFITGGGTGGHIYPAVAICEKLLDKIQDIEIYYIGNKKSLEEKIILESNLRINFINLKTSGFFNKSFLDKIKSLLNLMQSIFTIINIYKKNKPDFVIGTGGYVTVPVLIGAIIFRIPFALQEQNIIPGWTNQLFANFAKYVFIGFKESKMFFKKKNNLIYTGNPVRKNFYNTENVQNTNKNCVLIMGGSGGAKSLNMIIPEVVKEFENEDISFIHITGVRDYEMVLDLKRKYGISNYDVYAYKNKIWIEFNKAKIIICRAGAITISELLIYKIPLILIPFPFAVRNHQYWNAYKFKKAGIAEIIEDKNINKETLAEVIKKYFFSKEQLEQVKKSYNKIEIKNSTELIISNILSCIKE